MLPETEDRTLEASMLRRLMSLIPGYQTKCKTAQRKLVQHHLFDTPKEYWCCWVTDAKGKKFYALFDMQNVKVIDEDVKQKYIVKPVK